MMSLALRDAAIQQQGALGLLLDTLPGALGAWGAVQLRTAHSSALAAESGGEVTTLRDQSGNDRDAVQASAADRPQLDGSQIQIPGGKRIAYPDLPADYDLHVLIRVTSSARSIIFARGGNTDSWALSSEESANTTQAHASLSAVDLYIDAEDVTNAARSYVRGQLLNQWRVVSAMGMPFSQVGRAIGDFPTFELAAQAVALVAYPAGLHSVAAVAAAMQALIPEA